MSLVAYVRHTFTDYDELLAEGYDRDSARHFVAARMDKILQAWGVRRRLAPEDLLRRTNCIIFAIFTKIEKICRISSIVEGGIRLATRHPIETVAPIVHLAREFFHRCAFNLD
jgi:hypothetical protein